MGLGIDFGIVRRRLWLVLGIPILLGALVYISSLGGADLYRASVTLLINNRGLILQDPTPVDSPTVEGAEPTDQAAANPVQNAYSLNELFPDDSILETFTELITRQAVLTEVISTLGLPYSEAGLRESISSNRVQGTQLIRVSVTVEDPALAASIANETASAFIQQNREETGQGELFIVEPAVEPRRPLSNSVLPSLIRVVFAGLILGSVLALGFEFLDDKIRTPDDILFASGQRTLAVIDRFGSQKGRPREISAAEDYRTLRTNFRLLCEEYGLRTILVASSGRREGRSRTVLNLGYMLAEAGESVILVDADLRQPSLHKLIGSENHEGLSDLLSGPATTDSIRLESPESLLKVLPAGTKLANPSIVSFPRMMDILTELRANADYVILDTPALDAVVDASEVARFVDGIILLAEAGHTSAESLQSAIALLSQSHARIIGVVLNKGHSGRRGHGSYESKQPVHPGATQQTPNAVETPVAPVPIAPRTTSVSGRSGVARSREPDHEGATDG